MNDPSTNPFAALLLLLLIVLFAIWGNKRISESRRSVEERFATFEASLVAEIPKYETFTNDHPYVWDDSNYFEMYEYILGSARWHFSPSHVWPNKATPFSLRVNEERKSIYIAVGSNSFDWSSLYHYDEWLESMADVGKAINEHKGSTFRA
jgi:hypothetical protein